MITGVPEAKVNPLPPVSSSRYFDFISKLNDLADPCVPSPDTLCIFVAVARFLYIWLSSTNTFIAVFVFAG